MPNKLAISLKHSWLHKNQTVMWTFFAGSTYTWYPSRGRRLLRSSSQRVYRHKHPFSVNQFISTFQLSAQSSYVRSYLCFFYLNKR